MSRVIKTLNQNFTITDNRVAQCKDLDLNAKGLYWYIASLPDDWEFSIERIARANNTTEGKVKSAIEQLEKAGLLKRHYYLNSNGSRGFKADYEVFDFDTRISETKISTPKNSRVENLGVLINNNNTKNESIQNNNSTNSPRVSKDTLPPEGGSLFENTPLEVETKQTTKDKPHNTDKDFNEFWSLYPKDRAIDKPKCYRLWLKIIKEFNKDKMIEAIKGHLHYWQCENTPPQYIPHSTTWLNQQRYLNIPQSTKAQMVWGINGQYLDHDTIFK